MNLHLSPNLLHCRTLLKAQAKKKQRITEIELYPFEFHTARRLTQNVQELRSTKTACTTPISQMNKSNGRTIKILSQTVGGDT
jgi:hypothetical protein